VDTLSAQLSGPASLNMLTSLWQSLLLAAVLVLAQARPNSDDPVEGSGDDDQDMAISDAVNKVVELVDEVVSDLNDKIEDMEVNLSDNEIPDKKTKKTKNKKVNQKKCAKCVRKLPGQELRPVRGVRPGSDRGHNSHDNTLHHHNNNNNHYNHDSRVNYNNNHDGVTGLDD